MKSNKVKLHLTVFLPICSAQVASCRCQEWYVSVRGRVVSLQRLPLQHCRALWIELAKSILMKYLPVEKRICSQMVCHVDCSKIHGNQAASWSRPVWFPPRTLADRMITFWGPAFERFHGIFFIQFLTFEMTQKCWWNWAAFCFSKIFFFSNSNLDSRTEWNWIEFLDKQSESILKMWWHEIPFSGCFLF